MRAGEAAVWGLASLGAVVLIGGALFGYDISIVAVLLLLTVVSLIISQLMATDRDRSWLPKYILVGLVVKMIGSFLRYNVFEIVYLRQGDAGRYHGIGVQLAALWRNFQVPSLQGGRGQGTRFLEILTGLLYAPYTPDIVGGFLLFAMLGFGGQLLFYAAFRRALPRARLKLYAIAILFLPSIVFWPSSIGKDAVMLLAIGLAAYGVVQLLGTYRVRWLFVFAVGTALAAAIRPHVGALLAASLIAAAILTKSSGDTSTRFRKLMLLGIGSLATVFALTIFADRFGLSPEDLQIEGFLDELARRTGEGGSSVEGSAIRSLGDVPQAFLRVIFRPLFYEIFGPVGLASSVEGTALLLLMVWKLPAMLRNATMLRSSPYLMFCLIFTIGFVFVFSPILNLGILARQRTQMLPMLLALLVGMGWSETEAPDHATPTGSSAAALG